MESSEPIFVGRLYKYEKIGHHITVFRYEEEAQHDCMQKLMAALDDFLESRGWQGVEDEEEMHRLQLLPSSLLLCLVTYVAEDWPSRTAHIFVQTKATKLKLVDAKELATLLLKLRLFSDQFRFERLFA